MIVKIEHPDHGQMHVYSQIELDRHLAWGWRVMGETKQADKKDDKVVPIRQQRRNLGTRKGRGGK